MNKILEKWEWRMDPEKVANVCASDLTNHNYRSKAVEKKELIEIIETKFYLIKNWDLPDCINSFLRPAHKAAKLPWLRKRRRNSMKQNLSQNDFYSKTITNISTLGQNKDLSWLIVYTILLI